MGNSRPFFPRVPVEVVLHSDRLCGASWWWMAATLSEALRDAWRGCCELANLWPRAGTAKVWRISSELGTGVDPDSTVCSFWSVSDRGRMVDSSLKRPVLLSKAGDP